MDDTPKIYIADLADYNAGELRGFWLEVMDKNPEEMQKEITEFLQRKARQQSLFDVCETPARTGWIVPDHTSYSSFPTLCTNHPRLEDIKLVADTIARYGYEVTDAAFSMCSGPEDLREHLEKYYRGMWASEEDFAEVHGLDRYEFITGDYWSANLSGGKIAVFEAW